MGDPYGIVPNMLICDITVANLISSNNITITFRLKHLGKARISLFPQT